MNQKKQITKFTSTPSLPQIWDHFGTSPPILYFPLHLCSILPAIPGHPSRRSSLLWVRQRHANRACAKLLESLASCFSSSKLLAQSCAESEGWYPMVINDFQRAQSLFHFFAPVRRSQRNSLLVHVFGHVFPRLVVRCFPGKLFLMMPPTVCCSNSSCNLNPNTFMHQT